MSTTKTDYYWSPHRIRIQGEGPKGPFSVDSDRPFALIGTHENADVVLRGKGIARSHLYLHAVDAGVFFIELAGVHRSQPRLSGSWIKPGQEIRVGSYRLSVELLTGEPLQFEQESLLELDASAQTFPVIQNVATSFDPIELNRPLTAVGRNRVCPIRLATRTVAPVHCIIYQQQGEFWVVNVATAATIRVNGVAVRTARLRVHSRLKLGKVEMELRIPSEIADPAIWDLETECWGENEQGKLVLLNPGLTNGNDPAIQSRARGDSQQTENAVLTDESPGTLTDDEFESGFDPLEVLMDPANRPPRVSTQDRIQTDSGGLASRTRLNQEFSELEILRYQLQEERRELESRLAGRELRLNQRKEKLSKFEKALEKQKQENQEVRDSLRADSVERQSNEEQITRHYEEDLAAHLAESREMIESLKQDHERQVSELNEQLKSSLEKASDLEEQNLLEAQTLSDRIAAFEKQEQEWQDKQKKQTNALQRDAERVALEKTQLDERIAQFREEQKQWQQKESSAMDVTRSELAELTRLQQELTDERQNLEEQRSQWREERQHQVTEVAKQLETVLKGQRSLAAAQEQLGTDRTSLEQEQESWREEQRLRAEELRKSLNLLSRQETLLNEKRNAFVLEQEAKPEPFGAARLPQGPETAEVSSVRQQLEQEQARYEHETAQWREERQQLAIEAEERAARILDQQNELAAARKKLESEKKEFERFMKVDVTQRQLLSNLHRLRREKSSYHQFLQWLFSPFRRS